MTAKGSPRATTWQGAGEDTAGQKEKGGLTGDVPKSRLTLHAINLMGNCPKRLEEGNENSTYFFRFCQRSSLLTKGW